jgi:ABC-type transport system involved in multi-copper enzyme maturation permease subunit
MIWLTWRQFRGQALTAAVALAAFAVVLAATASHLSGAYASSGLATCHPGTCAGLASTFLSNLASGGGTAGVPGSPTAIVYFLSVLAILIAPAVTGVFWGAPLIASELDAGTVKLTWNQSITRTRWLAVKLILTGAAAIAVTETLSLIQAWWAAPIGTAVGLGGASSIFSETRFGVFVFPTHGITPLGYAAFTFTLGVTTGLLARRPLPAMATTLAIFAALQLITPLWIRPSLYPTSHTTTTIAAAHATVSLKANPKLALTATTVPGHPGAWLLSTQAITAAGQPARTIPPGCQQAISNTLGSHRGPAAGPGSAALSNCLASHGIRIAENYQPASHYWPLQWTETGMLLALTLTLAGYCFWRLNRRRT